MSGPRSSPFITALDTLKCQYFIFRLYFFGQIFAIFYFDLVDVGRQVRLLKFRLIAAL